MVSSGPQKKNAGCQPNGRKPHRRCRSHPIRPINIRFALDTNGLQCREIQFRRKPRCHLHPFRYLFLRSLLRLFCRLLSATGSVLATLFFHLARTRGNQTNGSTQLMAVPAVRQTSPPKTIRTEMFTSSWISPGKSANWYERGFLALLTHVQVLVVRTDLGMTKGKAVIYPQITS